MRVYEKLKWVIRAYRKYIFSECDYLFMNYRIEIALISSSVRVKMIQIVIEVNLAFKVIIVVQIKYLSRTRSV